MSEQIKTVEELMKEAEELGRGYFRQGLNCSECVLRSFLDMHGTVLAEHQGFIRYTKGQRNLVRLIDFFKNNDVSFGRVYSELPTLNDVFLEITGKELRD